MVLATGNPPGDIAKETSRVWSSSNGSILEKGELNLDSPQLQPKVGRRTDRDFSEIPSAAEALPAQQSVSPSLGENEAHNPALVSPHCVDEVIPVEGFSIDATLAMAKFCRPTSSVRRVCSDGKEWPALEASEASEQWCDICNATK